MKITKKRAGALALAAFVALGVALFVARPASADTTTVCATTAEWDYSISKERGSPILPEHFTADGLVLDLTGARANLKAAGYLGIAPTKLAVIAAMDLSLDVELKEGPFAYGPGYQLALDVDADGDVDGYLVGETVYGGKWWASSGLQPFAGITPSTGGGSAYQGTLAEFATANSVAVVRQIGFSYGSGVTGKVLLKSLKYGATTFQFKACTPPSSTSTTTTSTTTGASTSSSSSRSSASSTTPPSSSTQGGSSSTMATTTTPEPFYADCDAVKAALGHWIERGEPGYRQELDGDNDGYACDLLGASVSLPTTSTKIALIDTSTPENLALTGVGTVVPLLGLGAVLVFVGGGALILINRRRDKV